MEQLTSEECVSCFVHRKHPFLNSRWHATARRKFNLFCSPSVTAYPGLYYAIPGTVQSLLLLLHTVSFFLWEKPKKSFITLRKQPRLALSTGSKYRQCTMQSIGWTTMSPEKFRKNFRWPYSPTIRIQRAWPVHLAGNSCRLCGLLQRKKAWKPSLKLKGLFHVAHIHCDLVFEIEDIFTS